MLFTARRRSRAWPPDANAVLIDDRRAERRRHARHPVDDVAARCLIGETWRAPLGARRLLRQIDRVQLEIDQLIALERRQRDHAFVVLGICREPGRAIPTETSPTPSTMARDTRRAPS